MSSLTKFDSNIALPAFGLINNGILCYFNSMIQAFLSCTSVIALFESLKNKNRLCAVIHRLIESAKAGLNVSDATQYILNEVNEQLAAKKSSQIEGGMQDINESFLKFIDAFESEELSQLFEHKYERTTVCPCGAVKTHGMVKEIFIKFDEDQMKKNMADLILKSEPSQIEDYKCDTCNMRTTQTSFEQLRLAPEIIMILFVKYKFNTNSGVAEYSEWTANAPSIITLPSKTGDISWRLVALSEHSGGISSGHYWTNAQRKDGVYNINDLRVCQDLTSDLVSTSSTYLCWYHAC